MRSIAVVNQKGGCGKTTTAINLSGCLAQAGRHVLLVDMDPQGHATLGLSPGAAQTVRTVYEIFVRDGAPTVSVREITRTIFENLDLIPADILLSAAPDQVALIPGRNHILADALDEVRQLYDYIIIDCPPAVGLLTFNALQACSEAIVPMDPSFFSLHGLAKLLETLHVLEKQTGHQIAARGLVTLYTGRAQFVKDVVDEIRAHLGGQHYETIVRYSVKLAEAASHGLPIVKYSRHCSGFDDYWALAAEVMHMETETRACDGVSGGSEVAAEDIAEPIGPSAPIHTADGVVFAIEAPRASSVQLVGDFNEWALDKTEMNPTTGHIWKKVLKLQPGRYRYRYIVDGYWLSDPSNADVEPTPYGGYNSVCVVEEPDPA